MKVQRSPDEAGWWARHRGGRTEWFYVEMAQLEETGTVRDDVIRIQPMILHADTETFLPVEVYCSPLTRWYGPVDMPEGWSR